MKPSLIPSSYIALALSLVLGSSALAPTASAQANDPIDITAEEQEFADDCMIARGNVRVVSGDTVVYAPIATMYRGPDGQPQTAVFTGNPRLKQGQNILVANKLTFFIKTSVIVAEGNAHSEFLTSQTAGSGNATANGDDDEESPKNAKGEDKPQRIVTDSVKQVFEKKTGKFEAFEKVHVKTDGNVDVHSDHLRLVYGTNGKAEAVVFTGKVTAKKDRNVTQSETMTYFLTTKRMQATGHVKSKVIQERTATGPKKGGPNPETLQAKKLPVSGPISGDQPEETANQWGTTSGSEPDAGSVTTPTIASVPETPTPTPNKKKKEKTEFISSGNTSETQEITILSDAQDYNEETGRMDADGNVRVYMKDTIGIGPKVTLFNNEMGEADRVLFTGRSQIAQPGKKWIGDRITLVVDDRRVISEGNTRAIILGSKSNGRGPSLPKMSFTRQSGPAKKKPAMTNDFDQYVF